MANTGEGGTVKTTQEDTWFARRERELLGLMRAGRDQRTERDDAAAGDAPLSPMVAQLGFTPDTVPLLHLTPLLRVAWCDGTMSPSERRTILDAAASRGVVEGSEAWAQLILFLDARPSTDFIERCIKAIRLLSAALPDDKREATRRGLISAAHHVAAVSGGFLGLGKPISSAERAALDDLAFQLGRPDAT